MTTTVGFVNVGNAVSYLAQYDPETRWNGFLAAPRFDALTVVEIFEEIERWNVAANSPEYGFDFEFDGDVLVVTDRQWAEEDPEGYLPDRIDPDEDGLYPVGAFGWVWSEAPEFDDLVESIAEEFDHMRQDFASDPGGYLAYVGRWDDVNDDYAARATTHVLTVWGV
jgi:hypothetical protein